MSIKDKLKELALENTVTLLLALVALLLAPVSLALKSVITQRILPALSKEILAGLFVTVIILLLGVTAYVFYLRKELHRIGEELNLKLVPRFGILWSREQIPYCPGCSKPLTNYGEWLYTGWGFNCPTCKTTINMHDDEGRVLQLKEARSLFENKSAI